METKQNTIVRIAGLIIFIVLGSAFSSLQADSGTCGGASVTLPFTDIAGSIFFCQIAEAYFSGLTNGTTPTTYSPAAPVPREQMAAFVTRTLDQSIRRGNRRAALQQWWTPNSIQGLGLTTVGSDPSAVASDGTDLWVVNGISETISRVRASDGKLLGTWTGALNATSVLVAAGRVFITGDKAPGNLYRIDPTQAPGVVTTVSSALGAGPIGLAFDGSRIWTASRLGSISIVSLSPVSVTTVSSGFIGLDGIIYDGSNIWVTDGGDGMLKKLSSNGSIVESIAIGASPGRPVFDGTNLWVPSTGSMTVVRAATGAVLATLTGNGMVNPFQAAFDGERVLVADVFAPKVSLWKATDLSPLGNYSFDSALTGTRGVCSDGLNFWIAFEGTNQLARF